MALGSDQELGFRATPSSELAWPPVPASTATLTCYYVPPLVFPLALSADARWLTAGADGRALVLRRTSDGAELARTTGPVAAGCDPSGVPPLPMLAAFDPTGRALAVVWDASLAVYDVR